MSPKNALHNLTLDFSFLCASHMSINFFFFFFFFFYLLMKPILHLIAGNAKFFSVTFHPEPTSKVGCKKLQVHSAVKLFAVHSGLEITVTGVFPKSMKVLIFFVVVVVWLLLLLLLFVLLLLLLVFHRNKLQRDLHICTSAGDFDWFSKAHTVASLRLKQKLLVM